MRAGDKIGELELVCELSAAERTHAHGGREWLCSCSCGRQAVRTVSQLNYALRNKQEPCCQVCLEELRGGFFYSIRMRRIESFYKTLDYCGSLWSEWDEETLTADIRDDVAEELGFYPEEPDPFGEVIPVGRSGEDKWGDSAELVILAPNRELRMYHWLRWQQAVDFGMCNWGRGLPRPAIEKMLYSVYMEKG